MSKPGTLRIAVLGAGPIGIEAALYAKACGHSVTVYERGQVGEHLMRWGHVRMFTPFGANVSPLGMTALLREKRPKDIPAEGDLLTGRQFRDAYLLPLSESETLIESISGTHSIPEVALRTDNLFQHCADANRAGLVSESCVQGEEQCIATN